MNASLQPILPEAPKGEVSYFAKSFFPHKNNGIGANRYFNNVCSMEIFVRWKTSQSEVAPFDFSKNLIANFM